MPSSPCVDDQPRRHAFASARRDFMRDDVSAADIDILMSPISLFDYGRMDEAFIAGDKRSRATRAFRRSRTKDNITLANT